MGSDDKEILYLKLETCLNNLNKKMNFSYRDMSIGLRAFVACCHFVVDEVMKLKYNWFILEPPAKKTKWKEGDNAEKRKKYVTAKNLDYCRLQFQRAVHECISDLLDPTRLYGTNLVRKESVENMLPSGITTKVRGQYHRTSASISALMGGAKSADTRRFLSRCNTASYGMFTCFINPYLFFLMRCLYLVPIPGSLPSSLRSNSIQHGNSFGKSLLSPELTWNGNNILRNDSSDSDSKNQSRRCLPFSTTMIKKEHTELPISTQGISKLYELVMEKQQEKYYRHRLGKFSRVPDVKSRTSLLTTGGAESTHEFNTFSPPISPIK